MATCNCANLDWTGCDQSHEHHPDCDKTTVVTTTLTQPDSDCYLDNFRFVDSELLVPFEDPATAFYELAKGKSRAYGVYLLLDDANMKRWAAGVAAADSGAEICIEINGVAREMTFAEFAARLGFDAPAESS